MKNQLLKNESIVTNEDSCATDIVTNDDDERSQEYVPRRRISTINESTKEKEFQEENGSIPLSSSPKVSVNEPVFKQLKLDQFLKVAQPNGTAASDNTNHGHSESMNEDIHAHTRRITRHTRLHSSSQFEADPIRPENGISSESANHQELTNDEGSSLLSPNDSATSNNIHSPSTADIDRPIPLKRRSLTASNIQALIDEACSPPKVRLPSLCLNLISALIQKIVF